MTSCKLKWLKARLSSLGVPHSRPMSLYCDSQSALHMSQNLIFHECTKYSEIDSHFVQDEIVNGNINPTFVLPNAQLANIFIKVLGKHQYEYPFRKLGIRNLHALTRGGHCEYY